MSRANTPSLIRADLFKDARALQSPLNDALKSIQERLSLLEQAQGIALLGPRRIRLPVDAAADASSVVVFQLPEDFTPRAVFLVQLVAADVQPLDVTITPVGLTYEITGREVRVTRINTTTATAIWLDLTLGAIRG